MSIRKIVISCLAVIIGLTSLAGCSGQQPNVAAVVGDSTISTSTVENAYEGYSDAIGLNAPGARVDPVQRATLRAKVLWMLMLADGAKQIAKAKNIRVDQNAIDAFIKKDPNLEKYASLPKVKPYVDAFATVSILGQSMPDPKEFAAEIGKIQAKVNPRYGNWSLVTGPSPDSISGSLSLPVIEKNAALKTQPQPAR